MVRFGIHYFFIFAVMAATWPYFALLLRARGFSDPQIGVLMGLRSGAAFFGPLLFGYMADRIGRRRAVLMACMVAFGATLAPFPFVRSFGVAALLIVCMGMVARTAIPLTDALASGELENPARDYGRVRVWGTYGFVFLLATNAAFGLVNEASALSITRCALIAVALSVGAAAFLPDTHGAERSKLPLGRSLSGLGPAFWFFVAAAACHQIGMVSHYSFFTLYLKDVMHMQDAVWVWGVGGIGEILLMMFAGPIILRFGLVPVLVASLATVSIRLGVYALVPSFWPVVLVQLLHGVTFALFHAGAVELIRRCVEPARRGMALTLYGSAAAALPSLIGSSLGGYIIEFWGYRTLYLAYAIGPLAGVVLVLMARRHLSGGAD